MGSAFLQNPSPGRLLGRWLRGAFGYGTTWRAAAGAAAISLMLSGGTAAAEETSGDLIQALDAMIQPEALVPQTSGEPLAAATGQRVLSRRSISRRPTEPDVTVGATRTVVAGRAEDGAHKAEPKVVKPRKPLKTFVFQMPLKKPRMTSKFGMRRDPKRRRRRTMHKGQDFGAKTGTKILATGPGHVIHAGRGLRGAGIAVVIEHADGWVSRYFHMSKADVSVGDDVDARQLIGRVGSTGRSTGPHLHFELRHRGSARNPRALIGKKSNDRKALRRSAAKPVRKKKKSKRKKRRRRSRKK